MRANIVIFWLLCAFFAVTTLVYALWSASDPFTTQIIGATEEATGHPEWVGTVALGLSAVFSAFLAFYLQLTRRAQGGDLPEDRLDAAIDDGDPEIGHFSPWSWWPFVLGAGVALLFLGLAVGVWIAFIGAPIVVIAIIGWNYEYYRGAFAR